MAASIQTLHSHAVRRDENPPVIPPALRSGASLAEVADGVWIGASSFAADEWRKAVEGAGFGYLETALPERGVGKDRAFFAPSKFPPCLEHPYARRAALTALLRDWREPNGEARHAG